MNIGKYAQNVVILHQKSRYAILHICKNRVNMSFLCTFYYCASVKIVASLELQYFYCLKIWTA